MSDPNMDLNGRVYAITGGALGIGRCLTEELTRRGARVALIDKEADTGRALAEQLKREGGNVLFVPGDVAEEEALQSFVRRTAETFGGVDVLVNNACLHRQGLLTPCGYEDFNYVLRVGVTAPYMLTRLFPAVFPEGRVGDKHYLYPCFYVSGGYRKLTLPRREGISALLTPWRSALPAGPGQRDRPGLDRYRRIP